MKRAREGGITVMLDGQGGDELLGGYLPLYFVSYLMTLRKHGRYSRLVTEGLLSLDLTRSTIKTHMLDIVTEMIAHARSAIINSKTASTKREILGNRPVQAITRQLDDLAAMMEMDTSVTVLPALLRYEDKNSMWHSIEARVPFLDVGFFEWVASLPLDRKLRSGWTKHIFRLAMKNILPEKIRLRRTKVAFATPQKTWVETELREELKRFFSQQNLAGLEYYDSESLRKLLGKPRLTNDETRLIWRITSFELWYQQFFGKAHHSHSAS